MFKNKQAPVGRVIKLSLLSVLATVTFQGVNAQAFDGAEEIKKEIVKVVNQDGDLSVTNIVLDIKNDDSKKESVDDEIAIQNQEEKIQMLAAMSQEQAKVKAEIEEQKRLEAERLAEEQRKEQERIEAQKRAEQAERERVAKQKEAQRKQASQKQWIRVSATAYTASCDGCSGFTHTGKDVRTGNHRVIAVDPSVIPLGSLVEIEGMGTFYALDTGRDIKGHKIDILKSDKNTALSFGQKSLKIRIIKRG